MRMSPSDRVLSRIGLAALLGLLLSAMPADAAEKSLARYIPKADLLVYAEFTGLDAHAEGWRKTALHSILHNTPTGAMLASVFEQTADTLLANAPHGQRATGKQILSGLESFARSGFVVGINGKFGPGAPKAVVVIRDAGRKDAIKTTQQVFDGITKAYGANERITREDGRKITLVKGAGDNPSWAWWIEGDDLVVASPGNEEAVDDVVATLNGKKPSMVDAAIHQELAKPEAGFEPVFLSYADLSNLPPTPATFGLTGVKRIDSRWGFSGDQLMSRSRVVAPSPRKGVLALFDQPLFDAKSVPVPDGLKDFTVVSVDPGKLFDQLVAMIKETEPKADDQIKQMLAQAESALGVPLREELLGQIGPRMAFYIEPELVPIPFTPYHSVIDWGLHPPKLTALVEVRDPAKFAKTLSTLMDVANRRIKAARPEAPEGTDIQFRPMKGSEIGYVLDIPLGAFPLPAGIRPTLLLGKKSMVFAISPAAARKALAFESKLKSTVASSGSKNLMMYHVNDAQANVPDVIVNIPFLVQALGMFGSQGPGGPLAGSGFRLKFDADNLPTTDQIKPLLKPGTAEVFVTDQGIEFVSKESVPSINPITAGPTLLSMLLPAVRSAREAAVRSQSVNNIRMMMLAMHNYHSAFDTFPPAASTDADGKPLLSWRVAILPFIEQNELYKEFHLEEPWDSEHNKKLIERIPPIYKALRNPPTNPYATYYQVFTGNGAMFDSKGKGTKLADITDGTSNTFAIVEAGTAVPWTKPDDVAFDPDKDLPKLGGLGFPGGYNVGFADGSVRFIKNSINVLVLKALITRAGGEVIPADAF